MPIAEMFSRSVPSVDAWLGDGLSALQNIVSANLSCLTGMTRYTSSFYLPYLAATHYFQQVEAKRLVEADPLDTLKAYLGLIDNNIELASRSLRGCSQLMEAYFRSEADGLNDALQQQLLAGDTNQTDAIHLQAGKIVGPDRQCLP